MGKTVNISKAQNMGKILSLAEKIERAERRKPNRPSLSVGREGGRRVRVWAWMLWMLFIRGRGSSISGSIVLIMGLVLEMKEVVGRGS